MSDTDSYNSNYNFGAAGKAIIWMPRVSSLFSILGSLVIINLILGDPRSVRQKLKTVSNRFVLIISLLDVPVSTAIMFVSLAVPPDKTYDVRNKDLGLVGNYASCNAQAFFMQLGVAVPLYTAMLCIFYVCRLRFNIRESTFSKQIEPFAHIISFLFPFASAVFGASSGSFNSLGFFCWFASYPPQCLYRTEMECTRGQHTNLYRLFFFLVPILVAFVAVTVSMIMILQFVYKRRKQSNHIPYSAVQKQVTIQVVLYISVFLITYSFSVVLMILLWESGGLNQTSAFVPVAVLAFSLFPLQGFWNAFAYIRPIINQLLMEHPQRSMVWAIKVLIFFPHSKLSNINPRSQQPRVPNDIQMIGDHCSNQGSYISDLTLQTYGPSPLADPTCE